MGSVSPKMCAFGAGAHNNKRLWLFGVLSNPSMCLVSCVCRVLCIRYTLWSGGGGVQLATGGVHSRKVCAPLVYTN